MKALILSALLLASSAPALADNHNHQDGEIRKLSTGQLQAWDTAENTWVTPEQFWLSYAERKGGLTWGKSSEYPPYEQVKEFDTLLIQLDSGNCLMEFFHSRWRRANDVRRWDDRFNEYGGCPRVFD